MYTTQKNLSLLCVCVLSFYALTYTIEELLLTKQLPFKIIVFPIVDNQLISCYPCVCCQYMLLSYAIHPVQAGDSFFDAYAIHHHLQLSTMYITVVFSFFICGTVGT